MAVDPGPVPERGLVVRPQGEGFYARVSPRPAAPWGRWGAVMAAMAAVGVALAAAIADDGWLAAEIVACVALFGALLLGFSHGAGYFPVEITADDRLVVWGGDRFPVESVVDCVAEGRTLRLVGAGGRVLAEIEGVEPEVGRWLSLAVRASLPGAG